MLLLDQAAVWPVAAEAAAAEVATEVGATVVVEEAVKVAVAALLLGANPATGASDLIISSLRMPINVLWLLQIITG